MNTMTYKDHVARVDFDAEDNLFVGHLSGTNDVVGFHAETVSDLTSAFHEAVDDYLAAWKLLRKRVDQANGICPAPALTLLSRR